MSIAARNLRVGNLMTIDPILIDADAPASEAERLLKTHRVSGLPVVSGGATAGLSVRPTNSSRALRAA